MRRVALSMKNLSIILAGVVVLLLPGCATEETVTSTTTTEETLVHTPEVTETRTIRSY